MGSSASLRPGGFPIMKMTSRECHCLLYGQIHQKKSLRARARAFVRYTAPSLSLLADAVECPADGPASCSFFSHMECGTPPRASREAEVQRRALQEASSSLEFYGVFVVCPDRTIFARARIRPLISSVKIINDRQSLYLLLRPFFPWSPRLCGLSPLLLQEYLC